MRPHQQTTAASGPADSGGAVVDEVYRLAVAGAGSYPVVHVRIWQHCERPVVVLSEVEGSSMPLSAWSCEAYMRAAVADTYFGGGLGAAVWIAITTSGGRIEVTAPLVESVLDNPAGLSLRHRDDPAPSRVVWRPLPGALAAVDTLIGSPVTVFPPGYATPEAIAHHAATGRPVPVRVDPEGVAKDAAALATLATAEPPQEQIRAIAQAVMSEHIDQVLSKSDAVRAPGWMAALDGAHTPSGTTQPKTQDVNVIQMQWDRVHCAVEPVLEDLTDTGWKQYRGAHQPVRPAELRACWPALIGWLESVDEYADPHWADLVLAAALTRTMVVWRARYQHLRSTDPYLAPLAPYPATEHLLATAAGPVARRWWTQATPVIDTDHGGREVRRLLDHLGPTLAALSGQLEQVRMAQPWGLPVARISTAAGDYLHLMWPVLGLSHPPIPAGSHLVTDPHPETSGGGDVLVFMEIPDGTLWPVPTSHDLDPIHRGPGSGCSGPASGDLAQAVAELLALSDGRDAAATTHVAAVLGELLGAGAVSAGLRLPLDPFRLSPR